MNYCRKYLILNTLGGLTTKEDAFQPADDT